MLLSSCISNSAEVTCYDHDVPTSLIIDSKVVTPPVHKKINETERKQPPENAPAPPLLLPRISFFVKVGAVLVLMQQLCT